MSSFSKPAEYIFKSLTFKVNFFIVDTYRMLVNPEQFFSNSKSRAYGAIYRLKLANEYSVSFSLAK